GLSPLDQGGQLTMLKRFKHRPMPSLAEQFASSSFPAISLAVGYRWRSRLKAFWRLCLFGSTTIALFAGVDVAHAEPVAPDPNGIVVTADRIAGFVAEASQRFAIPSSWIRAVMQAESLGDMRALSPKGAMGL